MQLGVIYYSVAGSQQGAAGVGGGNSNATRGREIPITDEQRAQIAAHHAQSEFAGMPYEIQPAYETVRNVATASIGEAQGGNSVGENATGIRHSYGVTSGECIGEATSHGHGHGTVYSTGPRP